MLSRLFSLIALLAVSVVCNGQQEAANMFETTLDNGLHVILRPVNTAHQTTVMTLYDIGELNDPDGQSGLAHLMEHLLVTSATDEVDAMSADEWFTLYRSQANAQTGLDYTVVAVSVPNNLVEPELKKAAARFTSLKITDDDIKRETPRLLAELEHMYDGAPALTAHNFARSHIDPAPAGARRGGQADDVRALTAEMIRARYTDYYGVNNAALIVVGEFDINAVAELIGESFADLPMGKELPAARAQAKADFGGRKKKSIKQTSVGEGPQGVVTLAFRAPDLTSDDYSAFLVLVPRLYQQLIMRGVSATSAMQPFIYTPLDDPGAVYISHPIQHHTEADAAVDALWECVAAATQSDPNAALDLSAFQYGYGPMLHVMRVPDRIVAMNTYGEALRLGRFRQLGLSSDKLREVITNLYPDTLNEAAAKLFNKERSFTAVVVAE